MTRRTVPLTVAAALVGVLAIAAPPQLGGPLPTPFPLFPPDNWWNTDISAAPVDPSSAALINFIGGDPLHPDFGGEQCPGCVGIYGLPYVVVDAAQPKRTVTFGWPDESDQIGYPIPDEAITQPHWIEHGEPGNQNVPDVDRHMLIVDKDNKYLYELYNVLWDGSKWTAAAGAFFDMKTNNRRPEGWTSADAAGLAVLPGLVRYDEVYGPDEIRHALRFTVHLSNGYVYPASHQAGGIPGALPMGARLRLKAGKNISGFPSEMQKIFRAMKTYGLIVADNGTDMFIQGTFDTRWNNDIVNPAFAGLTADDFEVVELGWRGGARSSSLTVAGPNPVTEGNLGTANAAFTVTLSPAASSTVTVNYATSNGTATAGSDYVAASGTLTFAAGETSKTVSVVVNGDTVDEPNETFYLNLSSPTNAAIATGQATATIVDDDRIPYTLSVVRAGTGSGTVTSNPAGINCGADCSETYAFGTVVTLTAVPAAGSSFSGWSGPCSGTGTCQINMSTAQSAIANFTLNSTSYTLTVAKEGAGGGTVTSSPAGINCGTDCSEPYPSGSVVTLTAVPATGSTFAGWRNGPCSGTGSCQVPMSGAQSVTATFNANPISYTLTVAKAGTGTGTVTSSPAGVSCGADCSEFYLSGTVVTLTAAPASGSTFSGWSGACSGTGTCRVTMSAATAVTATFAPVTPTYVLSVVKAGTGGGTVTSSPTGISCGATCSAAYTSGVLVTLAAAPAAGSTFSGWSGGVCSGTDSCQVTMSAAKSVTATFTVIPSSYALTVARSGDGGGTVTSVPAGVNCGTDCSEAYVSGTVVTLTPTPSGGSVFAGWSGNCTGTGACQITMNGTRSVTASFALAMYSLTVTRTGSGSGTVASSPAGISCGADCGEPYNRGTVVALTATPDSGSSFGGWSGACTGSGACLVMMDGTKSVGTSFLTGGAPPPLGDFDRDGRVDLLWRHQTTGSLYVWFLVSGKMTSGASLQPDRANRNSVVAGLGDLDRDTHTDLLWQNAKTGALTAWLMNGTKAVSSVAVPPIALPVPSMPSTGRQRRGMWQARGLADFNRDGRDDVIWHQPQTGELYAWFMNGTTPVGGSALSPNRFADIQWQLRGVADFNGDGQADLVWHHQTTGDIYVWFMSGTIAVGSAHTNPSRFADTRWELVRVADFNDDGKPDLLWHHQTSGDLYFWYMNGLKAESAGYLDPARPSVPEWRVAPR